MPDMKLSEEGLKDLTVSEGFSRTLYDDGGKGKGHCTIGYGHLVHYGVCDGKTASEIQFLEKGVSKSEAEKHLADDVRWAEKVVNRAVSVALSQGQFDALVSFVYNVGSGNFSKSSVLKFVNEKNWKKVPDAIRLWKKSGGVVMRGLVTRREREVARFESSGTSSK